MNSRIIIRKILFQSWRNRRVSARENFERILIGSDAKDGFSRDVRDWNFFVKSVFIELEIHVRRVEYPDESADKSV